MDSKDSRTIRTICTIRHVTSICLRPIPRVLPFVPLQASCIWYGLITGSHVTPEFDLFCKEHSIITLCMPPHSSHLLQPLDVGCFSVLKRSYGRQIEGLMRNGVNHIDKQDFLEAYYTAHTETMNQSNIHSSFTATGVVPYDPERVLSKLNTQLRTPTPPLATALEQGPWIPETPHNTAQLELQSKAIKDYIKRRTRSPPSPTDLALNQLVKGCQMAMNSAVLLAEENRQLRAENERQKKKKAKRRSYSGVANQEATVQT